MWTDLLNGFSMLGVLALIVFFGWKLAYPLPEDEETHRPQEPEEKDPSLEPWRWY